MSLSIISKFAAISLGLLAFGEIYYELVKVVKRKLQIREELDNINEVICTNSPLNYDSKLICQISFNNSNERTLHVTEILKKLILSSRKTIHIAMYIFTNRTLAEALIKARDNGVEIYVIIDHSMEDASGTQVHALAKNGINVKIFHDNTFHHKFCLIDVPHKNQLFVPTKQVNANKPHYIFIPNNGILINGSLNWTNEGLTSNYENVIVTSNMAFNIAYANEFIARWNSEKSRKLAR